MLLTGAEVLQEETETKVTRIIVSSLQGDGGGRGGGRCLETCEWRTWQILDVGSTPAAAACQAGISNFITCHQRDAGRSGAHPSPPPTPPHPSPLRSPDITPSLEVVLGEKMKVFPAGGRSRRPAGIHTVSWLLIDLRVVKSS